MWDNEVTLCHNYLQVTLEQGVVPVSSPRDHEVPGWHLAGIVCLMGGRDSLALAGNPPSDGVTIKILVGENLTTHTSSNERMSNTELNPNDVNDTGAFSEGVASGRCPVDQQHRPGRHPATAEQ